MFIYNWLKLNNCLICQIDRAVKLNMCDFCSSMLPWISKIHHKCAKCHKELFWLKNTICDDCKTNDNYFDKMFAIFYYEKPIKNLLLDLKFRAKLCLADFFGEILYELVVNNWYSKKPLPQILIPMPLHHKRLRERGFNQSFECARKISHIIKINNTSCIRIKNTIPQNTLLKLQRKINVKAAFEVKKLHYTHIAILDDIITTGSTIIALCSEIKKLYPDMVIDLWCIARA